MTDHQSMRQSCLLWLGYAAKQRQESQDALANMDRWRDTTTLHFFCFPIIRKTTRFLQNSIIYPTSSQMICQLPGLHLRSSISHTSAAVCIKARIVSRGRRICRLLFLGDWLHGVFGPHAELLTFTALVIHIWTCAFLHKKQIQSHPTSPI